MSRQNASSNTRTPLVTALAIIDIVAIAFAVRAVLEFFAGGAA